MKAALLDLDGTCNCLAARKAARYLTAAYDKALAPAGLRITQFTILNKLARLGPMTITRLAAAMAMDRTTLATNLKPLERDGLVEISVDPDDRRNRLVALTASGRAKLAESEPLWKRAQQRFETGFGATKSASLRKALEYLVSEDFVVAFGDRD